MAPYGSLQWLRITQPLLTNGMTGNEYLYFIESMKLFESDCPIHSKNWMHFLHIVRLRKNANNMYPLVMTNIAMENGPFIDGLPIENGDFPWLC